MQIRWKLVALIAASALGVTALVNQKTATAAAPQGATSAPKTPPSAKNAKDGGTRRNFNPRYNARHQFRQAHAGSRGALRDRVFPMQRRVAKPG
jgi:hypothetical protein